MAITMTKDGIKRGLFSAWQRVLSIIIFCYMLLCEIQYPDRLLIRPFRKDSKGLASLLK